MTPPDLLDALACIAATRDGPRTVARAHDAADPPHVAGDYMGEHWLATFALLALEA